MVSGTVESISLLEYWVMEERGDRGKARPAEADIKKGNW